MADDALASGQPEAETVEKTPDAKETQTQTADASTETTETPVFTPEKIAEKDRAALLKWADERAEEIHRKKLNEVGYGVARVPQQHRERLKQNPNLIAELEAERDAFRRAALTGGVGPQGGNGVNKTEDTKEPVDDLEGDVRAFLISVGNDPEDPDFPKMLRYKVAEERMRESRQAKKQKAPDVEGVVEKKLTEKEKKRKEEEAAEQWAEIQASPEYNDPKTGPEFEGRLNRKIRELGQAGQLRSFKQVAELVKQEMAPAKKPAQSNKLPMGETSSGKVASTAKTDPWAIHNEAMRAA